MPIDLPPDAGAEAAPPPAMVTEHVLSADRLRQRGAVLAGEALADFTLLTPAGPGVSLSGLPDSLVLLDGLRLTPAADGRVDTSLLPLAWLNGAQLRAGPVGAAYGAGSIAGALTLALAPVDSGNRLWALAGGQAGRGFGGIDARIGGDAGWIGAGFTQGGALATPAGLSAAGQGRWHVGGRFAQAVGVATLSGRALLASRRDGADRADYHDLAVQVRGGSVWRWDVALATGGHHTLVARSRQALFAARASRATGLVLPGAVDPVSVSFGGEARRLVLGPARVTAQELFAQAYVPLLQDRPAAEDLGVELGWRQAWIGGRSEPLWTARARWEFFPGLALRGQVARGIDDLGTRSGIGRSIGLFAAPAFVPGLVLAADWRSQSAGPTRVRAVDVSALWRGRVGGRAQLTLEGMATWHAQAALTPLPVARFASLLRARVDQDGWAVLAGWRQRSTLAGIPARHWVDLGVERQLTDRIRLIASIGNAGDAGSAANPPNASAGRQVLLQLVAGF